MPVLPLPETNTKRYRLRYSVRGQQHSMQSRTSDAQSDANAVAYFNTCVIALQPILGSNVAFYGVEVADKGSNVFNPVGGFTAATGTADPTTVILSPYAWCFPGRTNGGRKSKVFVYGFAGNYGLPATYEEDPISSAPLQGFQGLLNSQSDFWLGIDGLKPVWYFRLTVKANDHFVDGLR